MKNIKKDAKLSPEFLEPTESQIYKARQAVINKYDIELPHEDAIRFARLFNELNWWIDIKNDPDAITQIVDELTGNDKKATKERSADYANVLLDKTAEMEKKRIGDEMTAIIESNKKN
ncbi:MAG: hypothetical protein WCO23_00695 [bacterium]